MQLNKAKDYTFTLLAKLAFVRMKRLLLNCCRMVIGLIKSVHICMLVTKVNF